MKRLGIFWLAGLIILPVGAGARLGETETQIAERYGHQCQIAPVPVAGVETACLWHVSIYTVYVGFSNAVSVAEIIRKDPEGPLFDGDEVAAFKAINGSNMTWSSYGLGIDQLGYQRSDKKAWCLWFQSDRKLLFCTDEVKQAIDATMVQKKTKQLAPF